MERRSARMTNPNQENGAIKGIQLTNGRIIPKRLFERMGREQLLGVWPESGKGTCRMLTPVGTGPCPEEFRNHAHAKARRGCRIVGGPVRPDQRPPGFGNARMGTTLW